MAQRGIAAAYTGVFLKWIYKQNQKCEALDKKSNFEDPMSF